MTNPPPYIGTPQLIAGLTATVILVAGLIADSFIFTAIRDKKIDWKKRFIQLKSNPWNHYDGIYILLVLGIFFAALILSTKIIEHCGIVFTGINEKILILVQTLVMHAIIIGAFENMRRRHNLTYKQCFSPSQLSLSSALKHAFVFYIAIIPPIVLIAFIVNIILQNLHIPLKSQQIFEMFSETTSPLWLRSSTIMLAVVFAPIIEETLFRGIALPIALKHTSPFIAIFATSAIFALIHANLQAIAPLFILAMALSVAYIYTRSLIVPIAMHAIFNTVSIILYTLVTL